jgi:hypothetical protein
MALNNNTTPISNSNEKIKWTKTGCNKYSVENLTDLSVDVTIVGETNTYSLSVTIPANSSTTFEVPSDGVYKVCVDGYDEVVTINSTIIPAEANSFILVYSFVADTPSTKFLLHTKSDGAAVYSGTDTTLSFATLTSNLTSAYGAGNFEVVAAGATPVAFPQFGVDATNWRIFIINPAYFASTANFFRIEDQSAVVTDLQPTVYKTHGFANYTGSNQYLTSLVIGTISSTDLLAGPTAPFQSRYNLQGNADLALFQSHLAAYLAPYGINMIVFNDDLSFDAAVDGIADFVFAVEGETTDVTSIVYSDLTVVTNRIMWCDYIYELCALHTCILKKLRDLLCAECDPCKNNCDQDVITKAKKAKDDVLYLSTLFFHGLIPLITQDRLSYMGDLIIDRTRIECSMRIKELYEKLVSYAKRCGECEECEDDCDCDPNTTTPCNNC